MSFQNSVQVISKQILLNDGGIRTEILPTSLQNRTISLPDKTGTIALLSDSLLPFTERIVLTGAVTISGAIGTLTYTPVSSSSVVLFVNGMAFTTLDSTPALSITGRTVNWMVENSFGLDAGDELIAQYYVSGNTADSIVYEYPASWVVPWVSLPLNNGWAYLSGNFEDAAYRKMLDGTVELKGLISKPSGASDDEQCANIPIACTSNKNIIVPSRSYNSATDKNLSVTLFIKAPPATTTTGSNFKPNGVVSYSPGRQGTEDITSAFWFSVQAIYRVTTQTASFFGDSNTIGEYLSPIDYTKRYSYLLCQAEGFREDNVGISGTVLQNTTTVLVNNARSRVQADVINRFPDRVYMMYGTNDVRRNDPNYTAAKFKSDYLEIIDLMLGAGINRTRITIATPPYGNPANYTGTAGWDAATDARYAQFQQAVREVAIQKRVRFTDVYQYMKDNGGTTFLESDGVHLNRSGHTAVSNLMRSAGVITQ